MALLKHGRPPRAAWARGAKLAFLEGVSVGRAIVAAAQRVAGGRELSRLRGIPRDAGPLGYDAFGMHAAGVAAGLALMWPLYRTWFRVDSCGIENLPRRGAALLVANHGGLLPFDGLMIWTDVVLKSEPVRVPRFVLDSFVLRLPVISTIFTRSGSIGGSRGDVHHLLERGEMVALFPEGTAGVGKPWRERYRLQSWSVAHAEMAIRHRAPVIPVAVVGPDDQFPLAFRLPVRAFGAPYLPIAIPPWPLPVRYRIVYGEPIELHTRWRAEDADLPEAVAQAAGRVRAEVQDLIDQAREGAR